MPSSPSLSSRTLTLLSRVLSAPLTVWLLRILVGGVFIFSGFVKCVDPWGSYLKIDEYFAAWHLDMPSQLVTLAAFLLGGFEFVWGTLLALGCYRRCSVWMLTLMMAFMLPLTFYIWLWSPVDDCGCFGDAWVISNRATFFKNIVITLGLVYLIIYNRSVAGAYTSYVQWIVGGLVTFYIFAIELFGYNIQPMVDFRRFPDGTVLVADEEDDAADVEMEFIYEKDGERRSFTLADLPDSTWSFVERRITGGEADTHDGFTIIEDGEDIAPELIDDASEMLLVTFPDIRKADLAGGYILNDLNDFITDRGGTMLALAGNDEEEIERWRDRSMALYPIITSERKQMLELARGDVAVTYLDHGRVVWKRTVGSISATLVHETPSMQLLTVLDPDTSYWLKLFTGTWAVVMMVLFILDRSGKLVKWHIMRRRKRSEQTEPTNVISEK